MTSGEQWIFFVYSTLVEDESGHVACSDEFSLGRTLEGLPLILGLLTDWVCFSSFSLQPLFSGSERSETKLCVFRWTIPLLSIKGSSRTSSSTN